MNSEQDIALPVVACCSPLKATLMPATSAERLATAYKALGHPIRLQMVHLLAREGGRVCVCDVEVQFDIKQPTISHHLRILREAGLVDAEQRGLYMYYRVTPDALAFIKRHLEQLLQPS